MWCLPAAIYWGSLGVIGYTYAGYPALIWTLSKLKSHEDIFLSEEPGVSILLAIHNEEDNIAKKLDNLLDLDYSSEKKEIIVVSDGSTDSSDEIVRSYSDRGVKLIRNEDAEGKAAALNLAVGAASYNILVFCDARQRIAKDALLKLMRWFDDEDVGAVSGELEIESEKGPGAYWLYEKFIRAAEAKVDSVVGATGALYAMRKALFKPLPKNCLLDDVFTPMQVVLAGQRVLFDPEAKVFDVEATLDGEFSRKARTLAGNYQLLKFIPELLNPFKNRLFFQFLSHKVMRLACPFALVTLLGSNLVLVFSLAPGWPFYLITLGGQLAGYSLALKGFLQGEDAGKLAKLSHTFVTLNIAAVEGLRRFIKGDLFWSKGH